MVVNATDPGGGRGRIDGRTRPGPAAAVGVAELAVHPAARRGGLGRRLLAALTDDRPAWLLTAPEVDGTIAFYDAAGWARHGTARHRLRLPVYTNRPLPAPAG